jgi:hypothetical protein
MLDGTALIMRSSMFADMLNTPISKLAVSKEIDFRKNFFDGRTLRKCQTVSKGKLLISSCI